MRELRTFATLNVGDVLLCQYNLTDKKTGEPYKWRWFGIATKPGVSTVKLWRIGASDKDRNPQVAMFQPHRKFWLLEESEWPDGVHAFRMRYILDGSIDLS